MVSLEEHYITTAISYTNGSPHIGHAYETILADAIARLSKVLNYNVFFCTGTDEHGQKIQQQAVANNMLPIELCDKYAHEFQHLNQRYHSRYDRFIRTTEPQHISTVHKIFQKCFEAGDIYLGSYSGYYSTREERFIPEQEAAESQYLDKITGKPLTHVNEPSYFFRLSRYRDYLIRYLEEHPNMIQPQEYSHEILTRLHNHELHDLSISRTTFDWGISIDQKYGHDQDNHVMYVWFDALINYLSAINYYDNPDAEHMWKSVTHVIGKDIIWFHVVIWGAICTSAGIAVPRRILVHGFVNDMNGEKMSKSVGNTIDPIELARDYPIDVIRYYLLSEPQIGSDISFSRERLITRNNYFLVNTIGNMISRVLTIVVKSFDGHIGIYRNAIPTDHNMQEIIARFHYLVSNYDLHEVCNLILAEYGAINQYFTECTPWKANLDDKHDICKYVLEWIYYVNFFLWAICPVAGERVFRVFGKQWRTVYDLTYDYNNLDNIDLNKAEIAQGILFSRLV